MLKNIYDVDLTNVFDTSVADLTFFKTINEHGLLPRYLRSYQVKLNLKKKTVFKHLLLRLRFYACLF